jgi:hypothetical protein
MDRSMSRSPAGTKDAPSRGRLIALHGGFIALCRVLGGLALLMQAD